MRKSLTVSGLGGLFALAVLPAQAQMVLEQSPEHRFQLDFHVNDAALQKMLPKGWEPNIAVMGPAKDCNLRVIFIDRMAIAGPDGKQAGKGSERLVYVAIPVKQTGGAAQGQIIIAGLTEDAANVPGAFGVYRKADTVKMSRNLSMSNGAPLGEEDWELAGGGERMTVHLKYERGSPVKGGGEVRFFNPSDPGRYQIFRTDQTIDILRNTTTNPPDRVKEFTFSATGGRLAALFDGKEKVLSWDSFPYYNRTILVP
uniref:Uncharacterized protein n=1 Tax=uncultured bacterium BLR9 TaxID=506525 RepID=C0INA7_9BACT|nr:hypothetical protein AKSOIL_0148 [uncultured bacterium BLR9]